MTRPDMHTLSLISIVGGWIVILTPILFFVFVGMLVPPIASLQAWYIDAAIKGITFAQLASSGLFLIGSIVAWKTERLLVETSAHPSRLHRATLLSLLMSLFIALGRVIIARDAPDLFQFPALYSLLVFPYFSILEAGCMGFVFASKEPLARKIGVSLSCIGALLIVSLLLASMGIAASIVATLPAFTFLVLTGAGIQSIALLE